MQRSSAEQFKCWSFQRAGYQSRLRKQVSLYVLSVKRENGALHGWTGWKGDGGENSQMFLAVPRKEERKLRHPDKQPQDGRYLWFFCQKW